MKMLKTVILGATALATVGAMNAETVRITGSTAFRKATLAAIVDQLSTGGKTVRAGYVASKTGLNGANQATFTNGTDTVQCCFAGSVGGVDWVLNQSNVRTGVTSADLDTRAWIAVPANYATAWATASTALAATDGTYIGTNSGVALSTFTAAGPATITMSDSFQSSTPFYYDAGFADMQGKDVGVVTFIVAKGLEQPGLPSGSYARLTNITGLQFQALASAGFLPLSFFTGDTTNDSSVNVVLVGRDADSGTRLCSFAEAGYGSVNTPAKQYRAFDASSNDVGTVSTAGAIKTLTLVGGTDGYSSGSMLKTVLGKAIDSTATVGGNKFILVGYAGTNDTPGAAQQLTWNGCSFSAANVQQGAYSFWSAQHMYRLPTVSEDVDGLFTVYTTDAAATIADSIATKIISTYATNAGLKLSDMQVKRDFEGGLISRK